MKILRSDEWNVHGFAGADSWISRFSAKCWQNVHFGVQKSSNLVDYASQKSKSSWNGSSEELFEVWVVGSTQIFIANLAVILVFSQTLINEELWRPDFFKNIIFKKVNVDFFLPSSLTISKKLSRHIFGQVTKVIHPLFRISLKS